MASDCRCPVELPVPSGPRQVRRITVQEWLQAQKPRLIESMCQHLSRVSEAAKEISPWAPDLVSVLLPYSSHGKMIRGSLVRLGMELFVERPTAAQDEMAIKTGAVMELFQSLLLIHDDIMDQDDFRRGNPSVHHLYRKGAIERGDREEQRLGESLGICLGDVSGFLAFEILADLDLTKDQLKRLIKLCSRELSYVGLAQMEDVHNGFRHDEPGVDDILKLYRYKTGRYTFSLPLMAGAILAGQDDAVLEQLGQLGEVYGIIFQIKDDEIGLFASQDKSGKPQGSDIREDKKTLFHHHLFAHAKPADTARLRTIYGNKAASGADIAWVLSLHGELGIQDLVAKEMERCVRDASMLASRIAGLSSFGTGALASILRYNQDRSW